MVNLFATSVLAALAATAGAANMNGEYVIGNPVTNSAKSFARLTNMSHFDDSGTKVEFFDVYSPPIRSRYGQTFWTMMDAVPLPKEIIERFGALRTEIYFTFGFKFQMKCIVQITGIVRVHPCLSGAGQSSELCSSLLPCHQQVLTCARRRRKDDGHHRLRVRPGVRAGAGRAGRLGPNNVGVQPPFRWA
eukprot:SAG11_NODE_6590_length_1282_cov_1.919696_2_plen_190_part_00